MPSTSEGLSGGHRASGTFEFELCVGMVRDIRLAPFLVQAADGIH